MLFLLLTFFEAWSYESYIDSLYITTTFDDQTKTLYIAVSDYTSCTLFAYKQGYVLTGVSNVQRKSLTSQIEIPAKYGFENLTNIFYYEEERHLLANYGREMVRILGNGKLESLTQLWNEEESSLVSGNITTVDEVNRMLYIQLLQTAGKNRPACTFIQAVDLVGSNGYTKIRSPCFELTVICL